MQINLNHFNGSEVDFYRKWFSDPDVVRFLHPNAPYIYDPNQRVEIEEFVEYILDNLNPQFLRVDHAHYGFIGHVSITLQEDESVGKIGIVIGDKKCWNKGIGTMVIHALLHRLASSELRYVRAQVHKQNTASNKIFRKLGKMIEEREDCYVYQIEIDCEHQ